MKKMGKERRRKRERCLEKPEIRLWTKSKLSLFIWALIRSSSDNLNTSVYTPTIEWGHNGVLEVSFFTVSVCLPSSGHSEYSCVSLYLSPAAAGSALWTRRSALSPARRGKGSGKAEVDEAVRRTRNRAPQRVKKKPGSPPSGSDVDWLGKRCIIGCEGVWENYCYYNLVLQPWNATGEQIGLLSIPAPVFEQDACREECTVKSDWCECSLCFCWAVYRTFPVYLPLVFFSQFVFVVFPTWSYQTELYLPTFWWNKILILLKSDLVMHLSDCRCGILFLLLFQRKSAAVVNILCRTSGNQPFALCFLIACVCGI